MEYPLALRYDLIVYGDSPDPEVIVYASRTAVLQADTLEVQLQTKKLADFIRKAQLELDHANRDLRTKLAEKEHKHEQKQHQQKLEETSAAAKQEIPSTVKKAMARLAKLTHPDKTDDEELHELFRLGKQLEWAHDAAGIEELIKEAIKKKGTRNLLSRMRKRFEKVYAENHAVNIQFIQLYNSPMVDIARKWYSDRTTANNMYRAMLQTQLQGMNNENPEPARKV